MRNKSKAVLVFVVLAGLAALAWAVTPHEEYAGLAIKDCNSCHKTSGVAPNHIGNWWEEHRLYAEKRPNNCADCHELSFCKDCHFGGGLTTDLHKSTSGPDYMPRSHRSDWRELHPIKIYDDPRHCFRCHDERDFCNECHSKFRPEELMPLSHRKGFSQIQVTEVGPAHAVFNESQCQTCHPNSLLPEHRWSREHAREARKNLRTCQSCHPEGDVCIKCHSARTGLMANPHPRGWDKISGKLRSRSNERTCVICHNEPIP